MGELEMVGIFHVFTISLKGRVTLANAHFRQRNHIYPGWINQIS